MSEQSTSGDPITAFGPNEWLVDELYQRYLTDKHSVDKAWWEFFEDYGPAGDVPATGAPTLPPVATSADDAGQRSTPTGAPAAPVKAEPAPAPTAKAAPRAPARRPPRSRRPRPPRRPRPRPRREDPRPKAEPQAEPAAKTEPKPRDVPAVKGPARSTRTASRRCAVRPQRVVANMETSLTVPDRHERARGAGQAAHRQPRRHQQPPRPLARRQGELHAPHRLRHGQGPRDHAGDEQRLHREGRPPALRPAGPRQLRSRHRPAEGRRHAARSSCPRSSRPRRWTSSTSGPPTRTWSRRPGTTS